MNEEKKFYIIYISDRKVDYEDHFMVHTTTDVKEHHEKIQEITRKINDYLKMGVSSVIKFETQLYNPALIYNVWWTEYTLEEKGYPDVLTGEEVEQWNKLRNRIDHLNSITVNPKMTRYNSESIVKHGDKWFIQDDKTLIKEANTFEVWEIILNGFSIGCEE